MPLETLRLIAAVRDALAEHLGADATVDERPLFGCHAFMVNGKLCLAVRAKTCWCACRHPGTGHRRAPGVRELDPRGGMPGYFWVEPVGYTTKASGVTGSQPPSPTTRRPRPRPGAPGPAQPPPRHRTSRRKNISLF